MIDTINADGTQSHWQVVSAFNASAVNDNAPFGADGIELLSNVISFGGRRSELLYDQRGVTPRMSIAVGVGYLAWNINNTSGGGSESNGVNAFGPNGGSYARTINRHLSAMGSLPLKR